MKKFLRSLKLTFIALIAMTVPYITCLLVAYILYQIIKDPGSELIILSIITFILSIPILNYFIGKIKMNKIHYKRIGYLLWLLMAVGSYYLYSIKIIDLLWFLAISGITLVSFFFSVPTDTEKKIAIGIAALYMIQKIRESIDD